MKFTNSGMISLIEKLKDDHTKVINELKIILDALFRIQKNGYNDSDMKILRDKINSLYSEIKTHSLYEENELLIKLKTEVKYKRLVTTLIAEHRIMWDKLEILSNEMDKYSKKHDDDQLAELKLLIESIYELISKHINREEYKLFPEVL